MVNVRCAERLVGVSLQPAGYMTVCLCDCSAGIKQTKRLFFPVTYREKPEKGKTSSDPQRQESFKVHFESRVSGEKETAALCWNTEVLLLDLHRPDSDRPHKAWILMRAETTEESLNKDLSRKVPLSKRCSFTSESDKYHCGKTWKHFLLKSPKTEKLEYETEKCEVQDWREIRLDDH